MQNSDIKILVVDDVQSSLMAVEKGLAKVGYNVKATTSPHEAMNYIFNEQFNIVVTDLKMPELEGTDILKAVKNQQPNCQVIVMTGYSSVESAVEIMNLGAFFYLKKPININDLRNHISKAIENQNVSHDPQHSNVSSDQLITESNNLQEILNNAMRIAKTKSTVLIMGESGTGKEILSRLIHQNSPRSEQPFIAINCSTFSETLLESQLFGYEKGAFTGAVSQKKGLFESANKGTIFLDEIGEMSQHMQAKLLRVIETKEFLRVGGVETIKCDVRIIAATNRDLKQEIENGQFREDLYYRLSVIHLNLPPLRERKDDIPKLVSYFLKQLVAENDLEHKNMSTDAIEALQEYDWPGNVRELRNIIERVFLLTDDKVITRSLIERFIKTDPVDQKDISINVGETMSKIEEKAIIETLRYTRGNRTKAAEILKIGLRTLQRKLKEYNSK